MNATTSPPPRRGAPAWKTLAWGLVVFVGVQLALATAMERWRPEWRDPEFGTKRLLLRSRVAEQPGRPLLLVLGSSRTDAGLRPDKLPDALPGSPVIFNFSLVGSGPFKELLCLHRLLAEGFHPKWLIVECWPFYWSQEGNRAEVRRLPVERLAWSDLAVVRRYTDEPGELYRKWGLARALPCSSSRLVFVTRYARDWLPCERRPFEVWSQADAAGWVPFSGSPEPEEIRRRLTGCRERSLAVLNEFCISEAADRSLHELLTICRRERIRVHLLFMPELSGLRELYPNPVRAQVAEYLANLCRAHDVPLTDARAWVPDEEFGDEIHLLPEGAARLTERLGHEVLPAWLASEPDRCPSPVTARPAPALTGSTAE
jgi:hypothetical protein